jgi:DNA polymerase (family X)
MGEIEAARERMLPRLIRIEDIQGIFHTHTVYSDGSASVETMVREASALGYAYIGISDHSQSAFYARGLKEDRVRRQHLELDEAAGRNPGIRIFKGIESDILSDGSLDYPPEILATFDFVIASIHSRFQMDEAEMTRRIVRAVENPATTILGHPTGRLLLSRASYAVNLDAVFDAAAASDVSIEINANPHRLDLDWRVCRRAKEKGVRFCINPDAHSVEGLRHVRFGVGVARKGWLSSGDIINTMTANDMTAYLERRKNR